MNKPKPKPITSMTSEELTAVNTLAKSGCKLQKIMDAIKMERSKFGLGLNNSGKEDTWDAYRLILNQMQRTTTKIIKMLRVNPEAKTLDPNKEFANTKIIQKQIETTILNELKGSKLIELTLEQLDKIPAILVRIIKKFHLDAIAAKNERKNKTLSNQYKEKIYITTRSGTKIVSQGY